MASLEQRRIDLDRERSRRSLYSFVKAAWSEVVSDPFVESWHIGAMCEALQALYAREIRELVCCVPPGMTKSLIFSSLGPAWRWTEDATERFLVATYEQSLGEKNAKLHRDLVTSDWYRARWGHKVRLTGKDDQRVRLFSNSAKGSRLTSSVGGAVLGRHVDCLGADDLVRAQDADNPEAHEKAGNFLFQTMSTRQANPRRTIKWVIAQRLAKGDVPEQCMDRGWHRLVLPMEYDSTRSFSLPAIGAIDPRTVPGELLCPERAPKETVDALRRDLGPLTAAAQLDQDPIPLGGLVFKTEWFQRRYAPGAAPVVGRCLFVDCSFKDLATSDEVSIRCGARARPGSTIYAIDEATGRWDLNATVREIERMIRVHKVSGIWVEDKANGPEVIKALRRKFPFVNEWQPRGSKEARAMATTPTFEAGSVLFPPESECQSWWPQLVKQATEFPRGRHDDRVDSLVMMIDVLADRVDVGGMLAKFVARMRAGARSGTVPG